MSQVRAKQLIVKIIENKKIGPLFYKMRLGSAYLAKALKPGQFVEIRCSAELDPLLRRPFSCHRAGKDWVEILYEVVGKGTEILSRKKSGEPIDIIGPLGNGFTIERSVKSAVLIAGGIGVAPLLALAESLRKKRAKVGIIIGAKEKSHILCEKEFKSLGCNVSVTTEDGSKGSKGLVTDALKKLLRSPNPGSRIPIPRIIFACGPNAMLKAIWTMAKEKDIPCQFSFESRMACGVGVCLGCPIKVRKGLIDIEYKMICKDGPVFNADMLAW